MGARSHSAAQGRKVRAGAHAATVGGAGGTWQPIVPQQQVRAPFFSAGIGCHFQTGAAESMRDECLI